MNPSTNDMTLTANIPCGSLISCPDISPLWEFGDGIPVALHFSITHAIEMVLAIGPKHAVITGK